MNSITDLTPQQLRRAANLKEKMASLQKELGRILGVSTPPQSDAAPKKRGKMSAAGRANIVAAQKARWAKQQGGKPGKATVKPKRKISAAGRKRLAKLAKARWAKARASGKKTLAA